MILRREDEEAWLDCAKNPFDNVESILQQFPSDLMDAHVTSTRVNNTRYNFPDCGEPADDDKAQGSLL